MNRRDFMGGLMGALGALSWRPVSALFAQNPTPATATGGAPKPTQMASGFVFHDKAGNGARGTATPGIAGVGVSNGRDVVMTDANGRYTIPVQEHDLLFVIKPTGWMAPLNEQKLPQFSRAHKPNGAPKFKYPVIAPTGDLPPSIDFGLRPQTEIEKFRVLLFGDPQPRNIDEIDYMMRDVLAELQGVDAVFGLSLGDVMFDNLEFYEPLNSSFATLGIPWYHTLGNHDMNYDSPNDFHSDETFKKTYGPSYYAFNYGPTHFIVLNNVVYSGAAADKRGTYSAGLGEAQLEFIRNDLKTVPRDRLVVVAMHIPVRQVADRQELYRVLEDRPNVLVLSAHTHVQFHEFIGEDDGWKGAKPLHHLNHATVCGSWWRGAPDETGVPHATMADGVPNGYSFLNFDGASYSVDYKAARHPANHQMNIWLPDQITAGEAPEVLVNVFAGSSRSTVEMKIGAENWTPLKLTARPDPFFAALKERETAPMPPPGRPLPAIAEARHIWAAPLPAKLKAGTHAVQIRTTDMWNRTHTDRRLLRVV